MHASNSSARRRWLAPWMAIVTVAALSACAEVPAVKPDTSREQLRARADLYVIDLPLVQRLQGERRSRVATPADLPAAFKPGPGAYEYRVAPQDVLRITVWNHSELTNPSGTTTELSGRVVNADGTLFFPFVGNIQAAGKSVGEIREQIATGLTKVIKTPQVDVAVLQYRGQRVYVSGEVRAPGSVPVTDVPPDLTEIVARAGGPTAEADLTAVTVTRGAVTLRVDLQALYSAGDLRGNARLRHGDIVNIPERRGARVFVTGEAIKPAVLSMPRGDMTLADALGEAGGANPLSASAGQVFVVRGGNEGRAQIYQLNATAPDALLLADRFTLQPRDVVYVDTAPVVRWARMINNILPTATSLRDTGTDTPRSNP